VIVHLIVAVQIIFLFVFIKFINQVEWAIVGLVSSLEKWALGTGQLNQVGHPLLRISMLSFR